jgi:catechol 2,3-dioxygenase-like lactoylglutathione lyase family enzyme
MRATRINHCSIYANDLEESARFYEELFGAERLPTAMFPQGRVLWLGLGQQQLHLFESDDDDPTMHHHFGMDVDDFDAVYAAAKRMGVLDSAAFGTPMRSHPAGWVQLYLRDPAGNLIEVDCPDVGALSPETLADVVPLADSAPQVGEAAAATLYHV